MSILFLLSRRARGEHPAFIAADVHHWWLGSAWCFSRRRWAVAGAVVLCKELFNTEYSGVVHQVPSTAMSCATRTQRVGPQSNAVVHIWKHLLLQATGG